MLVVSLCCLFASTVCAFETPPLYTLYEGEDEHKDKYQINHMNDNTKKNIVRSAIFTIGASTLLGFAIAMREPKTYRYEQRVSNWQYPSMHDSM